MPIKEIDRINERLDVVQRFYDEPDLAESVAEQISQVGDLERIASRIAAARVTPREIVQLKNSLSAIELLKALLESTDDERLHALAEQIDLLAEVRERIAREVYPDPQNNQIQRGGIIADGVDAVFTPTDNVIMAAELAIAEDFAKNGIPHYTGADSFALNGAFLGYGVDYANLGVETANMVAEVALEGKKPAELPVRTFDNG